MRDRKWTRREVLKTSTAVAAGVLFAEPIRAAAPAPTSVTPALIEAARKEGKVSYYSAMELNVAERLGKAFEAKYPGIAVRVERSGAERIFQRIAQEQASGINAVDVANSTDPAHYLDWKGKDWLAPYIPDDVARHFPADQVDPDGMYATSCGWIEVIGYNTNLVKPRRGAEKLRRSARSEVARQDRQGASELQRRDHDRDVRARTRTGLVVFRKACPAKGVAGAVGGGPAEKAAAGGAGRHGRRQRLQLAAAQGPGSASRGRLCDRRLTAHHRSQRRVSQRTQSECRAAVPEFLFQRRGPAIG